MPLRSSTFMILDICLYYMSNIPMCVCILGIISMCAQCGRAPQVTLRKKMGEMHIMSDWGYGNWQECNYILLSLNNSSSLSIYQSRAGTIRLAPPMHRPAR